MSGPKKTKRKNKIPLFYFSFFSLLSPGIISCMTNNIFSTIREVVAKIPKGKVTTYGHVAEALDLHDARMVGWAVYGNQNPHVPCHRVVRKDGGLAERFSLGGWQEQKDRLEKDGIKFTEEKRVDLEKYLYIPHN